MYISKNIDIVLIKREFHVVDDLIVKIFIEIDIMKLKNIIVDLSRDIMKINICENLEIFIVVIVRDSRTNAIVYNNKRITIPSHSNVTILVIESRKKLFLPENRDFIFEFQILQSFSAYIHVVDYTISTIFVKNDSKKSITLSKK